MSLLHNCYETTFTIVDVAAGGAHLLKLCPPPLNVGIQKLNAPEYTNALRIIGVLKRNDRRESVSAAVSAGCP